MQKAKNFNIILPTIFLRGLSITLLTLLFMLNFSAIVHAQPKLVIVGGTEFTLGVIPEDTVVHKTLIVKNVGMDTLLVQSVRTSCGCTVAKPSTDRVTPNDSMEIHVSFNTHNFDGPVKKEVYFETNDSTNLHMDIVLLATIKAMIELRPHYISFYEMKLHIPNVRLDTIRNNTDVAIRIESVNVHDPQITAILRDSILNARQFTILQTTINPRKYGNIFGQIDLTTNYPRKPSISLSYVAHVRK